MGQFMGQYPLAAIGKYLILLVAVAENCAALLCIAELI